MKKFGIVAGRQSQAIAGTLTKDYPDLDFVRAWADLMELKNDLTKRGREVLGELEGILVLDWGLPSEKTEEEFARITYVQNLFKAKDFFGTYLFICTKRPDLFKRLDTHFIDMPDSKYEGIKIDLMPEYKTDHIYALLTFPYAVLQYGSKELEIRRDEQRKAVETIQDTRRYYSLTGRREQILSQLRRLSAELQVVDTELFKYGEERITRSLESSLVDLDVGQEKRKTARLLEDEEMDKAFREEETTQTRRLFW